jgi:muconate cycloisomerase
MEHRPVTIPTDLRRDLTVAHIRSTIVDVPTVRQHKLSQLSVSAQSYVIVEIRLANGATGVGEAATLGGPRWSEESVEGIKAVIDAHLAPAVIGLDASRFEAAAARMDAAAKRNNAAKAAIESALFDAVGRTLGVPAVQLLGGVVRDRMPVYWTLASGDPAQEIEEAEAKLSQRLHDRFKIKIGAQPLADDFARLRRIAAALEGRATLIVDANQAWDEATAVRAMPALADMGVTLVEQPLPAWNIAGLARVRARSAVPVMADECVFTPHDMLAVAEAGAADTLSLKLVKHGGLLGLHKVAAVAEAAGVSLYGGCLLESSIGAAAHLHAFAGLRSLAWGCEHFGPHILTEDLAVEPVRIADFHIHLPTGPGLGVALDPDKLRRFARA